MTYAAIMAYTDGDKVSDTRIRLAGELADQFHATLIGIAACAPRPPLVPADLIGREIEAEITAIATKLAEKEKSFLTLACRPDRKVEWRASQRSPNDAIADEARSADLIVIGSERNSNDPFYSLEPGIVLLRVGRPVLVVPPSVHWRNVKRILIAWQDSREARRAVRDSLPFLTQADEILLTQVCDHGEIEPAKTSVHDVAKYLSRHRIGVSAGIMLKATGSVADELIRVAELEKIDLIVAGAYGHSRLGEWVFGGVTRDLLARCPVSCVFSH